MNLEIISYEDLLNPGKNSVALKKVENALLGQGIVGVRAIPDYENKAGEFIKASREFSALASSIKQQYTPDRDNNNTEGYELGAEWFKDSRGTWQIDDRKASYYALVPDCHQNQWPREIDLQTPFLSLGNLMVDIGKLLLNALGLDESAGLLLDRLVCRGRMLHYHKAGSTTHINENWCGAHHDHGIFTGLVPAYYFQDADEIEEPEEAGLYITPTGSHTFQKIAATDKSVLLFQVGEFGQLLSNDRMRATQHLVKKARNGIERFAFALFYSPTPDTVVTANSLLNNDLRYSENQSADGSITYAQWEKASLERYRVK